MLYLIGCGVNLEENRLINKQQTYENHQGSMCNVYFVSVCIFTWQVEDRVKDSDSGLHSRLIVVLV